MGCSSLTAQAHGSGDPPKHCLGASGSNPSLRSALLHGSVTLGLGLQFHNCPGFQEMGRGLGARGGWNSQTSSHSMSRSVISLCTFIKMDSQVARNNKWGPPRRPEHRWLQRQTLVGEMSLPLTQQSRDLAGQQGAWLGTQGGVLMLPLGPWPPGLPAIGLGAVVSRMALGCLQGLLCPLLGTLPTRPLPKAIGGDSRRGLRVQRDPECLIRERTNCRQAFLPPIQPLDLMSCEAQHWSQGHFSPRGPLLGVRGGLALHG